MSEAVKLAFASCSEDLIPSLLDEVDAFFPGVPLYVVSEFPPERGRWIPYHPARTFGQNLALVRDALRGRHIRLAGVLLQPRMPYWRMRLIPFVLAPLRTLIYNENLHHFMLRPRSLRVMLRHGVWRLHNLVKWELSPGGATYTLLWRLAHPRAFRRPLLALAARAAGMAAAMLKALRTRQPVVMPERDLAAGITIVVPSRNGRELLTRLLPGLVAELAGVDSEVMVVDNGSDDGTAAWLVAAYPRVALLSSAEPLSFARAVNLGINNARYSRVCLLNNDMTLDPGFFVALLEAFERVPGLFCATAQILFPEGERRQETGKAVMTALDRRPVKDFPIRCELPVEGENLSYVLYGSGGCSMYDTRKALALGGFDEIYAPAYVEDLDFGFRGWQQGWPSVFVAPA
ncbi:MAG: glycosyltransferase, partial [Acidobacteria bacterium]|nr:glycosyltransferase [Acidobacteriota bacterium]